MNLEDRSFESVELALWEDNQPSVNLPKGKYKKSLRRWGHVSCVFGGFMYVFGGEVDTNSLEIPHFIYKICLEDVMNNMWSQVGASSKGLELKGRDSLSAVLFETRWLLMFGNSMKVSISEILQYDFVAQAFTRITPKKQPIPREAHTSALIHNRFVICHGGITVLKKRNAELDRSHKLSIWDLVEESFVDVPDDSIINVKQLKARKNHTLTRVGNQLAVFGGSTVTSINKTNPEDLLSDMFLIEVNFFKYQDKSVKIEDPLFVMVSNEIYAKFTFVPIEYQGPRVQLHSHNANLVGNDLIVFSCGEVVIRDGNRDRVVCNTHLYCYSISSNALFDVVRLADKIPKRICSTGVPYLNGLFIYGGFNNHKKSLNSISIVTFNLRDRTVFPRTFSVDGKPASEMDDHELSYKMVTYSLNRKNEIVNSRYGRRLFEKNQIS